MYWVCTKERRWDLRVYCTQFLEGWVLTSDLWTSIATDGYIYLTAHFVDSNWTLHKRILIFFHTTPSFKYCFMWENIYIALWMGHWERITFNDFRQYLCQTGRVYVLTRNDPLIKRVHQVVSDYTLNRCVVLGLRRIDPFIKRVMLGMTSSAFTLSQPDTNMTRSDRC